MSAKDEPRRIALFLPDLSGGGAERAFVNLARGMADLGHAVDLVVGRSDGPLGGEIPDGVTLVDLGAPRMIRSLPGLVRYIRTVRPEAIYSALESANVMALLALRLSGASTKIFVSPRSMLSDEYLRFTRGRRVVKKSIARRLYPSADGIVAVSQGVADDAAAFLSLPRDRITVIANPTLTPDLAERGAAPVAGDLFAEGAPPVVLGCGRLAAEKDFATLVRAFGKLRRRRDARLVILGEGPLRGEIEALIAQEGLAGDSDLPGFDPNPFRYMAKARVLVLSSRSEGSPNVVVQALALGLPVVATDAAPGIRELLAGVPHGRIVDVGDSDAMAEAIADLLGREGPRPRPLALPGFDYLDSARAYLSLRDRS